MGFGATHYVDGKWDDAVIGDGALDVLPRHWKDSEDDSVNGSAAVTEWESPLMNSLQTSPETV